MIEATLTITSERRIPMSYAEFQALAPESGQAEWVDGEVILFMPPKTVHQVLSDFLARLIGLYIDLYQLGVLVSAPFEMLARPGGAAREPDLLFVARGNLERLKERRLEGPADLVIEIISDESAARDRSDKFYEYQEAGIGEYWIIDPRPGKTRADFYTLQADGRYQAALPDAEGWYHATIIPGLRVQTAWLLDADRPDPLMALAALRGLDEDAAQQLRRILLGEG